MSRPKHWVHLITNEGVIDCGVDLIIATESWGITIVPTMHHVIEGLF